MTNRNVRRIQSKITAITALAALLSLCFVMGAEAKPTTKRKPKPKPITTRPAKTTPEPPTTTVGSGATTPKAATPEAVTAAYQHLADVRYGLMVDPRPYKTELPEVASNSALDYYTKLFAANVKYRWTGPRDEFKSIDLRIQSVNKNEAVVRVCEWTGTSPYIDENGAPVVGSDKIAADELRLVFQYSAKFGWLVTEDLRIQDVEGGSKCADGKI
jgi:hypothetical protein